ncbi:uncharacterized protein LOC130949790 [Arachis stenosperma]|uniref:uncharacterized protein LOC130949790 n=1 Tax=Arachis stenosperma TaxID=217475 RepID=UPI0025ABFCDF|nr:uncharacterized protein LOC130949790 [Arachis stenosperma]
MIEANQLGLGWKAKKNEIAPSPSRRISARREIFLQKRLRLFSLQNSPGDKNGGTTKETLVDGSMAGALLGGPKVAIIEDQSVPVPQDKPPIEGVTIEVQFDTLIWRCSGIYGSSQFNKRVLFWDYLVAQSMVFQRPWIVLGDFNEVKSSHESKGCQFSHQRADMFANSLGDSGLFDLKTIERRFSWYRRVKNYVDMAKKLNRVCRPQPKGNRLFRFVAAWATHPGYRDIVNQSWWSGNRGIHDKLLKVQKNSLEFDSKVFGNIFVKKLQEELLWFQKSRKQWVRFGDRSTRFFHIQTLVRRKHNKIHGLFLKDGVWKTDLEVLSQEAESFYKSLFCRLDDVNLGCLGDVPLPSLNEEACNNLTAPVTMEEVRTTVFHMNSFKAPGPDGFQTFFFKEYWEIIGLDVWKMVKQVFSGVTLDLRMMETLLVLIPKVESPVSMKNFRPISLCNVVYKIIMKVLVNRFRPHLADIVGPLQGGFILGRGTSDNIIIAQEVLHFMKKTKSKKGILAFKIDLEKSYDRVDWSHQVDLGLWEPVAISRGGPRISHLMFTDDLLLFCKAKKRQVQNVMLVLETFCKASGMKINVDKSKALCSKNVSVTRKEVFTGVSSIRFVQDLGKYLGVTLSHFRVTCSAFNGVLNKIQSRLASWKGSLFNRAGRLCLVNSVAAAIPTYQIHVSIFSKGVISKLESMMGNFLWKGWRKEGRLSNEMYYVHISYSNLRIQDIWSVGRWHLDILYSPLSQNLKGNILSYNPDEQAGPEVSWYWCGSAAKVYDSRNGYLWLCKQLFGWEEKENWLWLWRQLVPEKHQFLAWLYLKEALPTASFRFRRGMSSSDRCPRCLSSQESIVAPVTLANEEIGLERGRTSGITLINASNSQRLKWRSGAKSAPNCPRAYPKRPAASPSGYFQSLSSNTILRINGETEHHDADVDAQLAEIHATARCLLKMTPLRSENDDARGCHDDGRENDGVLRLITNDSKREEGYCE